MAIHKGLTVEKMIQINASIDQVWDAITNPDKIRQYFFGTNVTTSWEQGDSIIFQGEFGDKSYRDKGNVLIANPPKELKYDYWSGFSGLEDLPENYSIVTYKLLAKEEKITMLYLTQAGFASEDAKVHSEGGWDAVLGNLKEMLESA